MLENVFGQNLDVNEKLWNYHIGRYHVLSKCLKDRKGKILDDHIHYCRIVTAIARTIELQKQVDEVYALVDKVDEVDVMD